MSTLMKDIKENMDLHVWCFIMVCKIQSISAFNVAIVPNAVRWMLTIIGVLVLAFTQTE